jgi:SpoVK/Ycf46/Vps4 family AAA+-type ATPase
MTDSTLLAALAQALKSDPRNGPLWVHYADQLLAAERRDDSIAALRTAVEIAAVRESALKKLVPLLRESGHVSEALIRAESWLEAHPDDAAMRAELAQIHAARGSEPQAPPVREDAGKKAVRDGAGKKAARAREDEPQDERELNVLSSASKPADEVEWASQFDWGDLRVTLDDVAGLEDVKRQIRLRILAPFKNPSVYEAFGRSGGGGLLLYGPPGCGKTYVARATAGELGARFVSVSIHDVLDKYFGESEKLIHGLFEHARRNKPVVMFFDEFDALGGPRGRGEQQFWKTLVDQLLQEMDGVGGKNKDVLLLAATNTPWNVDSAFRRPGRFDRVLFVPPPDEAARRTMLQKALRALPGGEKIKVDGIVKATELYSGADLRALIERASEGAIERSLESGKVHEVRLADFERTAKETRSSVLEWLATARNYAKYSNEGGQYDELGEYLKRVKRW